MGDQYGCLSLRGEDVLRSFLEYPSFKLTPSAYVAAQTQVIYQDRFISSSLTDVAIWSYRIKWLTPSLIINVGIYTNNVAYTATIQPFINGSAVGSPFNTTSLTIAYSAWGFSPAFGDTLELRMKTNNVSGITTCEYICLQMYASLTTTIHQSIPNISHYYVRPKT